MTMEQLIGQSFDRYRLTSLLGEGGMGAVFQAHDVTLQRDVAVKVMHPQFGRMPDFQERFLQEARSAARLNHPSIVQVYDFGQAHSYLYIVMEFIPGSNLRKLLKDLRATRQWLVLLEATELVRQVSLALDYAHRQGVLHRDVKPDNIMLKAEPSESLPYRPIVTDLGLAKLVEGGMVTRAGTSMGTPAYMSPEQALGEKTDARSDVYSLGILLYELAVGRLPFQVKTLTEAIRYHTAEPPPPPRSVRPDLPQSLERIILQALAKDPDDRFPDAKALAEALAGATPEAMPAPSAPAALEGAVSLLTPFQHSVVERRGSSVFDEFPKTPSDLSQDRIMIVAPDQTSRSVTLTVRGLNIGRGPDNDIVLQDRSVSRQHARVEYDGTNYRVSDLGSTNGTFLESVRLLPGLSAVWTPEKPLRIGDHWLRLERARRAPTGVGAHLLRSDGTMVEPSMIRSSPGAGRVGLFMETPDLSVEPGSSTVALLVVLNQGSLVDHFQLSVMGIPPEWVQSLTPTVRLLPGMHQDVRITIQPPRSSQSRAGQHPLTIRVASEDAQDQVAEISAILTVASFHQVSLDLRPRKQSALAESTFQVQVSNQSNSSLTLQLEAKDPEEGCQYTFHPAQLVVPAGEERLAQLQVQAKAPLISAMGKSYFFTVTARPTEAPDLTQHVQGEWVQTPPSVDLALRPQKQSGLTSGTFSLQVSNRGTTTLTLRPEATDPEEGCRYTLNPPEFVLKAGQERAVQLNVQAKSPLRTIAAKTYPFTVTVRPAEAPGLDWQVYGEWVHTPPVFDLSLHPQRQEGVTEGTFRVGIENRGDTDLMVYLEAADAHNDCLYTLEPSRISVPAGQERLVQLRVRAKGPLSAKSPVPFAFTVTARPDEAPSLTWQAHGEWVQLPPPQPVEVAQPAPRPQPVQRTEPVVQPPPIAPAKKKPWWGWGCIVLVIGLVLTFAAGYVVAAWIATNLRGAGDTETLIGAGVTWLVGLLLSVTFARKIWKRRSAAPSKPDRPAKK